jgi:hypothetical protein
MTQYIALKSHDNQAAETLILNENGSGVPLGNASAYAAQWGHKTGSTTVSYQVTDSAGAVIDSKTVTIALKPPTPLTATLELGTSPAFFGVLEALYQYIDNCHDAECLIDEDATDYFRNKLTAVEGFRDQLEATLSSLAVEKDQPVVVSEVEVGIPQPKAIELHLSGSPEFSKYSKKVKALRGVYSTCRGYSSERYVTLPWNPEGRDLADRLVKEFGRGSNGGTVVVVRGVETFRGRHVHAWVIVRKVGRENACQQIAKGYESDFKKAFPDCLVGV